MLRLKGIKKIPFISATILLMVLTACSGSRYLEMSASAEEAVRKGDFDKALSVSEEIIEGRGARGKPHTARAYSMAGLSAFELGDHSKSLDYLLKAQQLGYSDGEMYFYLARNYHHIDNLSKEIGALETYLEKFPYGRESAKVRQRLFETCIESENFRLGGRLWMEMDSLAREDVSNLETYLELNRLQENDRLCDSLAGRILEKSPGSEPALKWYGEYYFLKAESLYQHQMKAYKENRTHRQYAMLLEAFKQVSSDFRKSRDYFLDLYDRYPKPEYAAYLGNIYTRLEDEQKAGYYRKRSR